MPTVPDLVRLSKLEAQFSSALQLTSHVYYISRREQRRVRQEEQWKRQKVLGKGSYGAVYSETCIQGEKEGKVRAVKVIQRPEGGNYYRELEAVALFSYPQYERCFVKSFGWYENDDNLFITMEYLPHGDLHNYLGSPLPERDGQLIVSQILEGLDFMHENGFAHRDLKPANVLVVCKGPEWWVKIADFGISKRVTEELTALRTLTGTPAFAAPEVLGYIQDDDRPDSSYTNAVDVWATGVITFLILTGETYFKDLRRLGQYSLGTIGFLLDTLLARSVSKSGCDFTKSLMSAQPKHRPGVKECLQHTWLTDLDIFMAFEMQSKMNITNEQPQSSTSFIPGSFPVWNTQNEHTTLSTSSRQDSPPSASWSTHEQCSEVQEGHETVTQLVFDRPGDIKATNKAEDVPTNNLARPRRSSLSIGTAVLPNQMAPRPPTPIPLFDRVRPNFSPKTHQKQSKADPTRERGRVAESRHSREGASKPAMIERELADPEQPQQSQPDPLKQSRRKEVKFGDYVLGQTLGEGEDEGSKVKMGCKKDSTVLVAIKLIRKSSLQDNTNRLQRLYREITILRDLQHPHIIRLHEFVETERHMGLVLEYASGGELFDFILSSRYLEDSKARRLFAQLVSGIAYLHKKGIVHRHLELSNLLLDRNRNLLIIGFGMASPFNPNDKLGELEDRIQDNEFVKREGLDKLTADGLRRGDAMQTTCGAPYFAAPEMVVSDSLYAGRKVDVWSCGVVLYAMLAGHLPFDDDPANPEGDNINLLYKYIVSTPLKFPEYVTRHARDLLCRVIVPDPRKRATLFEVASHSWLSEYRHVVNFIQAG